MSAHVYALKLNVNLTTPQSTELGVVKRRGVDARPHSLEPCQGGSHAVEDLEEVGPDSHAILLEHHSEVVDMPAMQAAHDLCLAMAPSSSPQMIAARALLTLGGRRARNRWQWTDDGKARPRSCSTSDISESHPADV